MSNPTKQREAKNPQWCGNPGCEQQMNIHAHDCKGEKVMTPENQREPKYTIEMICENCLKTFRKDFKKGCPCHGFYECEHCGCKEARMK